MTKSSIEVTLEWAKTLNKSNGGKIKVTTYKNGVETKPKSQ